MDECGAPVVSICGGEPMIYPGIGELVAKIQERKKVVILCTNGMFIRKKLGEFRPSRTFFFNVHLDGMKKNARHGRRARGRLRRGDRRHQGGQGGRLPRLHQHHDLQGDRHGGDRQLFAYLTTLGVDGFIISPAYSYAAVNSKEIFMTRDDIKAKFRAAEAMFRKYRFHSSPIYLEFLQGKREMQCTAWASPTRNIKGWKGPCYLITDTHHETLRRPLEQDRVGQLRLRQGPPVRELHGARRLRDRRAAVGVNSRLGDTLKMIKWQLTSAG